MQKAQKQQNNTYLLELRLSLPNPMVKFVEVMIITEFRKYQPKKKTKMHESNKYFFKTQHVIQPKLMLKLLNKMKH